MTETAETAELAERLTKEECFRILDRYKGWNTSQTSVRKAMHSVRTQEDDVLDARRKMLIAVYQRLERIAQQ